MAKSLACTAGIASACCDQGRVTTCELGMWMGKKAGAVELAPLPLASDKLTALDKPGAMLKLIRG